MAAPATVATGPTSRHAARSGPRVDIRLRPREGAPICVVCRGDAPVVVCRCGARYHDDCRTELRRCATNGCAASGCVVFVAPRVGPWRALLTPAGLRRAAVAGPFFAGLALLLHTSIRPNPVPLVLALGASAVAGAFLGLVVEDDPPG